MPFGKKRSATKAYLDKKENDNKTVIDEIKDALNSVHYICPTKEECEKIKLDFKVLNENLSEKNEAIDINKVAKEIEEVIEKYPSTLKDGQNFDNSGSVPEKVLKDISKRCGLTYGKITQQPIDAFKYKNSDNKKVMKTICNHLDRLKAKFENEFNINNDLNKKNEIKTAHGEFKELKEKVINVIEKFNTFFLKNSNVEECNTSGNILAKIYKYLLKLSSAKSIITEVANKFEKVSDEKKRNYQLAYYVPKGDFWNWIRGIFQKEKSYVGLEFKDLITLRDDVEKLIIFLKKIYKNYNNIDENQESNVVYDLWQKVFILKEKIIRYCKKIQNVRGEKYINESKISISKYIEEDLNFDLNEKSNKGNKFNFNDINSEVNEVAGLTDKFKDLKSLKMVHKAKIWMVDNWPQVVSQSINQILSNKKTLAGFGIKI